MQQIDIFLLNCCCLKLVYLQVNWCVAEMSEDIARHFTTLVDIWTNLWPRRLQSRSYILIKRFFNNIQPCTMYTLNEVFFQFTYFISLHSISFYFILFGFIRFFTVFPTVFYILLNCPSAINSAIFISIIIVLFFGQQTFHFMLLIIVFFLNCCHKNMVCVFINILPLIVLFAIINIFVV